MDARVGPVNLTHPGSGRSGGQPAARLPCVGTLGSHAVVGATTIQSKSGASSMVWRRHAPLGGPLAARYWASAAARDRLTM
eukprot:5700771-Alexandrium_andersonii.AAC.1